MEVDLFKLEIILKLIGFCVLGACAFFVIIMLFYLFLYGSVTLIEENLIILIIELILVIIGVIYWFYKVTRLSFIK